MATIRYIDFNRGSDAANGNSPATAWKNLSMMDNFNPGAGGGIYLASDSIWEINPTRAVQGRSAQTQFNGAAGNPAFITSYVPSGATGSTKPTIRYRMFPTASDWTWDSTDNFGFPRGWYIQLDWNLTNWDALVKVGDVWVGTMNQDTTNNTGGGYINGGQNGNTPGGYTNGMSINTLRFNLDYAGGNVGGKTTTRLYLSGAGLLTSGAGNDPSSVYGPGQIMLGFGHYFSFYDSLNYVTISGLKCEQGAGLFLMQATADTIRAGLEVSGCEFDTTNAPFRINSGTGSVATTKWGVDIHDNTASNLSGPAFLCYGVGVAGYFRDNTFTNGNLCSSMGGGVYIQNKPSTYGGVRDPFVVKGNIADTWKNGAGNNSFDGGCYYADIQDEGTIFTGNVAKNSYVAYQCGSGSRSEWYGNVSINCEKMGMFNNALSVQANDYHIANNLHIGAARGSFTHGDDADTHQYAFTIYHSGTAANNVSGKFINNVLINADSDPTRIAVDAYDATQWASGKLQITNNAIIGFNARQVVSDFNVTDRTSQVNGLNVTQAQCKFLGASDYRINPDSPLWKAGVDIFAKTALDQTGQAFYSPPSVGAYEVQRMPDYFGLRPALS